MRRYTWFIAREALPLLVTSATTVIVSLFLSGIDLALPDNQTGGSTRLVWCLVGLVSGALTATWDELRRTTDYVRHRRLSSAQQRRVAHLVVVVGLVAAAVVAPVLLYASWFRVVDPSGPLLDPSRVSSLLALGTCVVAAYGAGAWVGSLPAALGVRFVVWIAAFGVVSVASGELASPTPDEWSRSAWTYVLVQLAVGAGLLGLAFLAMASPYDEDRERPALDVVVHCVLACVVLSLIWTAGARRMQARRQMTLWASYPMAVEVDADGRLALLSNRVRGAAGFAEVDEQHRAIDRTEEIDPYHVLLSPWQTWVSGDDSVWEREALVDRRYDWWSLPFQGPHEWIARSQQGYVLLDRSTGWIEVCRVAGGPENAPHRRLVGRAPDTPFARDAVVWSDSSEGGPVVLFDPSDRSVWSLSLDDANPSAARPSLPGDAAVTSWGVHKKELWVASDQGSFRLERGEFVEVRAADAAALTAKRPSRAAADPASLSDPLTLRVEVMVGGIPHELTYEPKNDRERADERAILLTSLLMRPPALLLASYLTPTPDRGWQRMYFSQSPVLDPLFFGGKRSEWLMAAFALAALLAAGVAWRLARVGATRGRTLAWVAITLAFGLPAFWLAFMVESRRAWRWRSARFEPAEPPRIGTVGAT